jgi:NAD(P) transhydrogenase subunit alpha
MALVFVPKETRAGETRVACSPETVKRFVKSGLKVAVQKGAGEAAGVPDAVFAGVGAELVEAEAWERADMIVKVAPPTVQEAGRIREGALLVAILQPSSNRDVVEALRDGKVTTLAMDLIPRISRAQSMDVLSSQATVGGYKAVLLGASHLKKLCPLLMTAAGTVPPARVVVFGAGVAGLMAIATARRLGCVVEATDVRMAAKDQVESLGGRFIEVPGAEDMEDADGYAKEQSADFLERQREEVKKRVAEADLVITTAQIPGRRAPVLVDREMLRSMNAGSVLVDMAVESGGNCELSEKDRIVVHEGVTLIGVANLPATVPLHASELYAKNVLNLVKLFLTEEGELTPDFEDEVLSGCRLTAGGEIHHGPTREALGGPTPPAAGTSPTSPELPAPPSNG